MALVYFGSTVLGGLDSVDDSGVSFRSWAIDYACPAGGSYNLKELTAYCKATSGSLPNVRLAIYTTSNDLVYQSATVIAVPTSFYSWIGETAITGATLTGGQHYKLACSADDNITFDYILGSAGDYSYYPTNYTGGFPSSLADGVNDDYKKSIRAGVESALLIEQEGFRFINDDGNEATATFKAAQDVSTNITIGENTRLRFLINITGDASAENFQLEYKRSTESTSMWCKVTT